MTAAVEAATAEAVLPFEDVNPFDKRSTYYSPNEDFLIWRGLLRGLHIRKAAGICSAGEIGFFSLLTHVREELLLIDHAYGSLGVAMCKFMALRELGGKETTKRLSTHEGCKELLREYREKLPESVRMPFSISFLDSYYTKGICDEWEAVPSAILRKACNKLDRVKFIHGDLSDLKDKGEFDLLYLSNALEHTGRNGGGYNIHDQVNAAVRNGGHVLAAGRFGHRLPRGWKLVRDANQDYSTKRPQLMGWYYGLYRVEK